MLNDMIDDLLEQDDPESETGAPQRPQPETGADQGVVRTTEPAQPREPQPTGQSAPMWGQMDRSTRSIIAYIAKMAVRRQGVKVSYNPKVTTQPGGSNFGKTPRVYRTIFPYSLRLRNIHTQGYDQPAVPVPVIFGFDPYKDSIKMFVVNRIYAVEPTNRRYVPEWPVEFESLQQEMTGTGNVGGYAMPLGATPYWQQAKKNKKKKKVL